MLNIYELKDKMDLFDDAVHFFWKQWGNEGNFKFYQDCMTHSLRSDSDLPRFYLAVQDDVIVGSYALLRNDLISRQDLFPWFACLFVIPERRGSKVGSLLLQHALHETHKKGYKHLYLCTDLDGYYEKYGWEYFDKAYIFNGEPTKVYVKYVR